MEKKRLDNQYDYPSAFLCKNLSKPNIWIIRIGIRVSRKVGFTLDIFKWEGGELL